MRLEERKRAAEIAIQVSRDFGGVSIVHIGSSNTRRAVVVSNPSVKDTNATSRSLMTSRKS